MTSSSSGHELSLTISPYGYIEWRGPRARIEATGLVPANLNWPARAGDAVWHAEGFEFWLRRCRPDGLMGPMHRWTKHDYWFMRRIVRRHPDGMLRIHEPYRAFGDILFLATSVGEALSINFSKVHADERIEKFEVRLVPQDTILARPVKPDARHIRGVLKSPHAKALTAEEMDEGIADHAREQHGKAVRRRKAPGQ